MHNEKDYPSYLEPLNPEQRRAVLHTGKPGGGGSLLILAGAGSGKTRVITTKIAYLIREQGLDPRSILAVTFTNKAAKEMADRAKLIEPMAGNAMLRTFHSFGAWFLRRNGSLIGLDSSFVIYDDDNVISLLSTIMENSPKPEVKKIARGISRAKDYFLLPDDPKLAMIDTRKKFCEYYMRYEERMSQIGNVDFGDLIKKPVEILQRMPEVAVRFRDRFKVILVDEYQDANVAQFHLLKELCGQDSYVCVVGDDDQSIYRFRGAEVKNILEFPDRFPGADIIRLNSNYRSTSPILNAASSVVDCNSNRHGKSLYAEKGNGPLPVLAYLSDQDAEVAYCADKIADSVKKNETEWSDWAILYRTNAQSLGFETVFLRRNIPYRIVGAVRFYEREEIRDALAFLILLVNPRDEVAFRRVVNKPARGIGGVSADKIVDAAVCSDGDLIKAGKDIELSKKARGGLDQFIKIIMEGNELLENPSYIKSKPNKGKNQKEKKDELVAGEGLSVCMARLIKNSGLAEYYKTQDEITGNSKLGNLQELVNAAIDYKLTREGLLEFLEDIELDRTSEDKNNAQENAVTLITFHNTKGLEFKRVIMTGLEQGIFPREEKKGEELEEERRLFYVGATRAMDELYFTSCAVRRMYGKTLPMQPSLFLQEIDKSCLEIISSGTGTGTGFTRSYNAYNFNTGNTGAKLSNAQKLEQRAGYKRGQRIYHDDFGYGAVMEIRDGDDGPSVRVRFDSGNEKVFNSRREGRAYEKIGEE